MYKGPNNVYTLIPMHGQHAQLSLKIESACLTFAHKTKNDTDKQAREKKDNFDSEICHQLVFRLRWFFWNHDY